MTISAKSVKTAPQVTLDPNFFLPPNVVDMRYADLEVESDSATTRSTETGEVINVDYQEVDYSEIAPNPDDAAGAGNGTTSPTLIQPPDSVTVVSQTVRQTADGKFVVDVTLDVEDIPGVVQYDVRLTKP